MEKDAEKKNDKYQRSQRTLDRNQPCILLAEDDEEMRSLLALMLRKEGYQVTECPDGMSLLDQLSSLFLHEENQRNFDLIISDIRMPGVTGMEILTGVSENKNFPPMILITAFGDKETHIQAKQLGVAALFDKPFDIDDMLNKVRDILLSSV